MLGMVGMRRHSVLRLAHEAVSRRAVRPLHAAAELAWRELTALPETFTAARFRDLRVALVGAAATKQCDQQEVALRSQEARIHALVHGGRR